jgi:LmbE family N-acetylglucosaminyl deacetylase
MRILIVSAHPDDAEFGCYGTLLKHFNSSDTITYLVLTLGGDSGNPQVRREEQLSTSLGIVHFGALKSAFLDNNSGREAISLIEKTIDLASPDIIYTHSSNDRHQDHRAVNRATLSACRFFKGQLYFYEGFSSLKRFRPNKFVDISDYFDQKLWVMRKFKSQASKFYMNPELITAVATFRAAQAGFLGRAEAFEVGSIVG